MRIIAGRWRGHAIKAPRGRNVRPTTDRVREAWMGSLMPRLPGAVVLDLFAGSGALGLEALSRGAEHVVFVERAKGALDALEANVAALGAREEVRIVRADALKALDRLESEHFDLAVADPPYGEGWEVRLLERFLARPFAREFWVEHRSRDPVPEDPRIEQRRYGDTTLTHLFA